MFDGFDLYNGDTAPLGFLGKWTSNNSSGSLVTGRFTGQAYRPGTSFSGERHRALDSAVSALTPTFAIKVTAASTVGSVRPVIVLKSAATYMVGIAFEAGGVISAYRLTAIGTGTLLGSSAISSYSLATWHSIEAEVEISDTTGRVTVYVDGVSVLNLTSQDTRNGAPTTVDTLGLASHGSGGANVDIDDLWVEYSGTKPTKLLRVETIRPNADGATLNWTPSTGSSHFAVVDDTTVSEADYLQASVVGDVDELSLGNLSSTPTLIKTVNAIGYAKRTDATARSIALGVKSGATNSDGANFALAATTTRFDRRMDVDPDTSAAWLGAAVDALQGRPKVTV